MLASPLALASDADLLKQADFPAKLQGQSPVLERKNQAILTYMWANVYAAAFYAESSTGAQQAVTGQTPQRLELYYFRDIDREDVIKAANATLERQQTKETLARLRPEIDRLHKSFQNIRTGDRYELSWDKTDGLTLTRNTKVIFASPDAELAKVYLAIWLAPDGLSDKLREALLK
ncbi:chalcone isomerase family protein [Pseudomonas huanghezhanensis]|uniref:chalcone isomerase family protein n=1 Tax=Pseudomonas huanghezhanensis TaxID=3002903 RepID=UPI0038B66C65